MGTERHKSDVNGDGDLKSEKEKETYFLSANVKFSKKKKKSALRLKWVIYSPKEIMCTVFFFIFCLSLFQVIEPRTL